MKLEKYLKKVIIRSFTVRSRERRAMPCTNRLTGNLSPKKNKRKRKKTTRKKRRIRRSKDINKKGGGQEKVLSFSCHLFMTKKPAKTTQKKASRKNSKAQHIPTTIRDSIPYEKVYDNGIIEIRPGVFSKSYQLTEANFKTLDDENQWIMAEKWSKFLSSFEPDVTVEVTIYNRTLDIMQFQEDVLIPMKMDNLDKYRAEYNDMLLDKIAEAKNNLESVKLITLSTPAPDVEEAASKFRMLSQKYGMLLRRRQRKSRMNWGSSIAWKS